MFLEKGWIHHFSLSAMRQSGLSNLGSVTSLRERKFWNYNQLQHILGQICREDPNTSHILLILGKAWALNWTEKKADVMGHDIYICIYIYLGSNISSTESDVNICIGKAWNAIDWLSIIWKSDLFDKIKQKFLQAAAMSVLLYSCTTLRKTLRKKARWELHTAFCYEQILEVTPHKATSIWQITSHLINYARHCWRSKDELVCNILQWTPTHGHTSVCWPEKNLPLCTDTECHIEDLVRVMADRGGCQERVTEIHAISTTWWWRWWWYIKYHP